MAKAKKTKISDKKKILPAKKGKVSISKKVSKKDKIKPIKKNAIKKIIKKVTNKKVNEKKKIIIKKNIVDNIISKKGSKTKTFNKIKQEKPVNTVSIKKGEFPAESLFKARIKVIGIGGGGGSIVSEIERSITKATFLVADTDIRALKKRSGVKYFWFGEELTHGLGTGVNVDLARKAAESSKEKISQYFKDQDIIIFVASLGGGLGSGATQVFAEAAKEFGGITFGIFTLPFKFEGKNKYRIAQNALKSLRQSLNVSLVIPNEKIFKIIDESTPITNAFSTVNKSLIESLESLIDLIYNPGIINIDFADLRTILKGKGNSAFLNTVEASGSDKVDKICSNIFKNPLLQNNGFKAEKILFNIVGSDGLSMFDVEKISSHISSNNHNAKIIFGISKDTKLKNKIRTTILMTGGQTGEDNDDDESYDRENVKKTDIVLVKEDTIKKNGGDKPKIKKIDKEQKKDNKKKKAPKSGGKLKNNKEKKDPIPKSDNKDINSVPIIPVFKNPIPSVSISDNKKIDIIDSISVLDKKTIRRSALEIKEAEEMQEKKKIAQEKEWEIPTFLRKVKFNK